MQVQAFFMISSARAKSLLLPHPSAALRQGFDKLNPTAQDVSSGQALNGRVPD